jgi:hypothetical protein
MSQVITGGDRIVGAGDSTMANGSLDPAIATIKTTINTAQFAPFMARGLKMGGFSSGPTTASPAAPSAVTFVNTGVGGAKIADLDTNFATLVTAFSPTVIIIMTGINDIGAPTDITAYRTSWNSVMAKCNALGLKIWALTAFAYTETYATGPLRWNGPLDFPNRNPGLDDYNAQAQASVLAAGGTWVDDRAAGLALEPTGNPTNLDHGYLLDASFIHFTNPAGFNVASQAFLATVTLGQ